MIGQMLVLHVFGTEQRANVDLPRECRMPTDVVVTTASRDWTFRLRGQRFAQVYLHEQLTQRDYDELRIVNSGPMFTASSR